MDMPKIPVVTVCKEGIYPLCGGKVQYTYKGQVNYHVHHLESRKVGGDAPDNQITLCEDCRKKFHKGIIANNALRKRMRRSSRDATFMGIMRKTLISRLRKELPIPVWETHGYVTKYTRTELLKLGKSHVNDALAIAAGNAGFNVPMYHSFHRADRTYLIRPVRHHNRQLHKTTILKGGIRKSNQAPRYVKGFRLFDKVLYQGTECFVWGRRSSGYFMLRKLDGEKVSDSANCKHLTLLVRRNNYLIA